MESSLTLEKERLGQELSIGYKYFKNLNETLNICQKLNQDYAQKEKEISQNTCNPKYENLAEVFKCGDVKFENLKAIDAERNNQVESLIKKNDKCLQELKEVETKKSANIGRAVKKTVLSWFFLSLVLLSITAFVLYLTNDSFRQIFSGLSSFWVFIILGFLAFAGCCSIYFVINDGEFLEVFRLLFCVEVIEIKKEYRTKIARLKKEIDSLPDKIVKIKSKSNETILSEMTGKSYSDSKLIELIQKHDPEVYSQIKEIHKQNLEEYKEKLAQHNEEQERAKLVAYQPVKVANETLDYYRNDLLKEIHNYLQVIPQDYFTEEAITGMLYYYTNKRGDTIKELINLYEDEKFKESLLGTIRQNAQTMESIGKTVVIKLQTMSHKMDSLQMEMKAVQNSMDEISRSNMANAYSVLAVMQQQMKAQQEQYVKYAESVKLNNNIDSSYKNLTVAIDGHPVDVKIYG